MSFASSSLFTANSFTIGRSSLPTATSSQSKSKHVSLGPTFLTSNAKPIATNMSDASPQDLKLKIDSYSINDYALKYRASIPPEILKNKHFSISAANGLGSQSYTSKSIMMANVQSSISHKPMQASFVTSHESLGYPISRSGSSSISMSSKRMSTSHIPLRSFNLKEYRVYHNKGSIASRTQPVMMVA